MPRAAALLSNTDVGYHALPSLRPTASRAAATPSSHGHGARAAAAAAPPTAHPLSGDEAACRDDKGCRLAFRDSADLRLGAEGRRRLRAAALERLAPTAAA